MSLLTCGWNHQTTPLALREHLAFDLPTLEQPLHDLLESTKAEEAAILSTCHRTEIYTVGTHPEAVIDWVAHYKSLSTAQLYPHSYHHHNEAAIRHVLRVAAGLDSLCLGEPQILGQIKKAYAKACASGTIGYRMHPLFQRVFGISKKIRHDTAIGIHPVTIAYAAVQMVKKIFANFESLTALLIGSGTTIQLACHHFYRQGIRKFIIANRSPNKVQSLITKTQGLAISLPEIIDYLPQVDIIISATGSPLPILGKGSIESALKKRKRRPIFMVDLAVPRDIEPEVSQLEDVFLYNVDDIKGFIEDNINKRQAAALKADSLIEKELADYHRQQENLNNTVFIKKYRAQITKVAEQELVRAVATLRKGQDAEKVLQHCLHRLVHKIMHHPTMALKHVSGQDSLILDQLQKLLITPTEKL